MVITNSFIYSFYKPYLLKKKLMIKFTLQLSKYITSAATGDILGPLCVDPGLENLFMTNSTETKLQLMQIKQTLCSQNNSDLTTRLITDISNRVNITALLQKVGL